MVSTGSRRRRLHLTGQVQGVGFRPYAYHLARSCGLTGFVINDASGAIIEVQGRPAELERFARRLPAELPPLAEVQQCRRTALPVQADEKTFEIRPSADGELTDAQVTPDTATCEDCLRELFDPADPRYRYPFINCTNCGPRYSIVKRIPYDRPNTTMADFAMCRLCASQYADPADRRFHAQPIACGECGPSCWLTDTRGRQIVCDDPIAAAADLIRQGRIVAIKGLGGFHLACRADDDHIVRRLRLRKNRDAKPFALMVRDLAQARQLCEFNAAVEGLLTGPQHPICLLKRRADSPVAKSVAPGLPTLGVMLPYTPLHHLLLACDLPPLVMTSGNVSDEPLVTGNEDAIAHLGRIADAILLHNRRIERSLDDSVVQARSAGSPVVLRRARGYAPRPVRLDFSDDTRRGFTSTSRDREGAVLQTSNMVGPLPHGRGSLPPTPCILAVGAELKNTVCLYEDGRAVLSEHIGDLKDGRVYRHFMQVINDLEALFDLRPEAIVADMHPQYLSTEYALRRCGGELAGRPALPLVRVQHHHAHIVSAMAEHGRADEVIGIACDGTGYGDDGAIWGCEIMRASPAEFVRLGHLRYFGLPGGDAAAVETARPALSLLWETFGQDYLIDGWHGLLASRVGWDTEGTQVTSNLCHPQNSDRAPVADSQKLTGVIEQLSAGVNCPPTSSLGRLFDAVAAMCGLAQRNRYEGEAPMLTEGAAAADVQDEYPFALTDGEPFEIDYRPMIEGIVGDIDGGEAMGVVSAKFHNTVVAFLAASARRACELTGLKAVALSGGCFANLYLTARLVELLRAEGFDVLTHRNIPCNDGGVALGQAVIAARQLGVGWAKRSEAHLNAGLKGL